LTACIFLSRFGLRGLLSFLSGDLGALLGEPGSELGTTKSPGGEGLNPGRLKVSASGGFTASSMGQVEDMADLGLGVEAAEEGLEVETEAGRELEIEAAGGCEMEEGRELVEARGVLVDG